MGAGEKGISVPAGIFNGVMLLVFTIVCSGCSSGSGQNMAPVGETGNQAALESPSAASSEVVDSEAVIGSPTPLLADPPAEAASPTPGPGSFWSEGYADTGYLLPLTVQFAGEENAVVHFELEQAVEGFVLVWLESGSITSAMAVPLQHGQTIQLLTLEGLTPGSEYIMEVGLKCADGFLRAPAFRGDPWGAVRFRTIKEQPDHLRVGVIGDSGFGEPVTYALGELMAESSLDFVIHTGDVVYSMGEQPGDPYLAYWLKYYLPFKPVLQQMPIYPVPGNHEYDAAAVWSDTHFYYQAFPSHPLINDRAVGIDAQRRWYALELDEIQFLMLDSETVYGAPGRHEMQEWLENRLADDRFNLTIPVTHIPPFTSGIYVDESTTFRQLWHELFRTHGVPLVLSGHDHNYQRTEVDGITYLISGGGSTVLYAMQESDPGLKYFQRVSHFVVLDISEDSIAVSSYDWQGYPVDEVIIDLQPTG